MDHYQHYIIKTIVQDCSLSVPTVGTLLIICLSAIFGSLFLVPCFWFPVFVSLFLVPCFWFPVFGSLFLVPCFCISIFILLWKIYINIITTFLLNNSLRPETNLWEIASKLAFSYGNLLTGYTSYNTGSRIVHLNFRAGSTFPFPVCTVLNGQD